MIVDKYGNYVLKFMWQLCGWGMVDICMRFHKRAFDFFLYHCTLTMTMNCQRNVISVLRRELPHKFSYIGAILINNHFESSNIN
jgi:hypothetical protein